MFTLVKNGGLLITMFLSICLQLYSDAIANSDWLWATKIESISSITPTNTCSDMAVDNNGNTYVAGVFGGEIQFGSIVLTCQGNANMYLSKLNSNGEWMWAKRFTTDDNNNSMYQRVKKLEVVGDSVFLLGNGYFPMVIDGVAFESNSLSYPQGPFIARFNENGICNMGVVLNPSAGILNNFINFDQLAINSSSIYVAGSWNSPSAPYQFGDITVSGYDDGDYTDLDILYAKIDHQGNLLWVKSIGGPSDEELKSMCCDSSGNIYMGGDFISTMIAGDTQLVSSGFGDAFVIKLDQNGYVVWGQKCGGVREDTLAELRERNGILFLTGTYIMQAYFGSLSLEPLNTTNQPNVYFASLANNGTWVNVNRIGGANPGIANASSLVIDNSNAYILIPGVSVSTYYPIQFGDDFSWYLDNTQNISFYHIIAGLNLSTNHWFGLCYAEAGAIWYFTKLKTIDQFLYLGTPVIDQANFGDINIIATTYSCYAIGKINKNQVVENDDETNSVTNHDNIKVFPNPSFGRSSTIIEFDTGTHNPHSISIYNNKGQIVKSYDIKSKTGVIEWDGKNDNGTECSSGVYYIRINSTGSVNHGRFVFIK